MTPVDWLRLIELAVKVVPALAEALIAVVSGSPAGQRVRDVLVEHGASERAAEKLRREIDV